jgi:hypothetical protein
LQQLHQSVREVLDKQVGEPISVTTIVDIMNLIGRCVVSGNVRRTAEIAFGDPLLDEYLDLKNYSVNPHRAAYGWTSNNSVRTSRCRQARCLSSRRAANGCCFPATGPGAHWNGL